MSHSCRGIGAFAHAIKSDFGSVLNRTKSATAAALLLASAVAPGIAFAQSGPTKTEVPLMTTIVNPCTGESVDIVGTLDTFIYLKSKNTGAMDVTVRVKNFGTGVSQTTGATYIYHSDETTRFNDVPLGSFDSAMLIKTMLVRQGGGEVTQDDWMFKNTMRIKIAESGAILVDREAVTDTCS
jgi:hypothetical protein